MFTEVKLKNGKGTHYGLGVEVRDLDGHRSIEHSGEVSGFVSDNEVLIDDGAAVAVLTNQDAVGAAIHHRPLSPRPIARRPPARLPPSSRHSTSIAASSRARIDRTLLAPNLSDYFTAEALPDFQPASRHWATHSRSIRPAGAPRRHDLPRLHHHSIPIAASSSPPTPTPTASWSNT